MIAVLVATALTSVSASMATSVGRGRFPTAAEKQLLDSLGMKPAKVTKSTDDFFFKDVKSDLGERTVLSVIPGPGQGEFTLVATDPLSIPRATGCGRDLFNNRKAVCDYDDVHHWKYSLRDLDDTLILNYPTGHLVWVDGGSGNDVIITGQARDLLQGGSGNDLLNGGANDDVLLGDDGNDILIGGTGADRMFGGAGLDTVSYKAERRSVTVTIDTRADDGPSGEEDLIDLTVENVIGGRTSDTITGSNANNIIQGMNGNDTIDGGRGLDTLDGGGGNDTIRAKDGQQDRILCGGGIDIVFFDVGLDLVSPDCEILNP